MSFATTQGTPIEPPLSQPLTNKHPKSLPICQACSNQIEDQIINCDKCQAHFHLRCTSAASDSPGATISCKICNETLNAEQAHFPRSQPEAVSVAHSVASSTSRLDKMALEIKRLEEERAIQMDFVKKKYQILENETCRSSASSSKHESVRQWLDSQPRLVGSDQNVNSTHFSFADEINQLTQIQFDPIQNSGNENSALTLQPLPKTTSVVPTLINRQPINSTMHAPIAKPALINTSATKMPIASSLMYAQPTSSSINIQFQPSSVQPTYSVNAPIVAQRVPTSSHLQMPGGAAHNLNQHAALANHTQQITETINSSLFNTSAQIFASSNLSTDQVHARQSVPKELPIFTGMPEEWPLFSSTFDWSTKVCGLTEAENLIRMQRALRGEALRAVQHILIHPSCVPAVMSTLNMLFGQPDKILHSLLHSLSISKVYKQL